MEYELCGFSYSDYYDSCMSTLADSQAPNVLSEEYAEPPTQTFTVLTQPVPQTVQTNSRATLGNILRIERQQIFSRVLLTNDGS